MVPHGSRQVLDHRGAVFVTLADGERRRLQVVEEMDVLGDRCDASGGSEVARFARGKDAERNWHVHKGDLANR